MATRPCPASVVVLEPAQATPVLERQAAARPTALRAESRSLRCGAARAAGGSEHSPEREPIPSAPRAGSLQRRRALALSGFRSERQRAPRPRLGQNPRTLPQAWLVVRVEEAALRARHLGAARARLAGAPPRGAPTLLEPAAIRPAEP